MNITFLVGNGFDRNLGLNTAYSDFIRYYKTLETDDEDIKRFRKHIKENEELWSDAELEIGRYTDLLCFGDGDVFSKCHVDFCSCLADYLKKQETRINYVVSKQQIIDAFKRMNSLASPFPTQERDAINAIYSKYAEGHHLFSFICFNYTYTLDKCLDVVKQEKNAFGAHTYRNTVYSHVLERIHHVHGSVDGGLVFGVNDDTQITNLGVFDCDNGDIYKSQIVKIDANASYQENADEIGRRLLMGSHLIYIYGMSIGDTDKLWWNRVCKWLLEKNDRHIIIQKYTMPEKLVVPTSYQLAERQHRRLLLSKSTLSKSQQDSVEGRIHITSDNLFEEIKNIADPTVEDQLRSIAYEMIKENERKEEEKVLDEAVAQLQKEFDTLVYQ